MSFQFDDSVSEAIPVAPATPREEPSYWSGVLALSVCAFALVASEFMPVSLLTPIASELKVTEGLAGQAISISGAFAVLTSLSISSLSRGISRKSLLLLLTGLMFLSGPIIAMAPNYAVYMAGRILIGIAIGGFWSMSAAAVIDLVPKNKVPKALAILNGGNALATVVAAPLGSYLGAVIGWRGAFFCLVPCSLLAFIWQWVSLPSMKRGTSQTSTKNLVVLFKNPVIALGMVAASLFFMGQFTLFTYLRPFLETITQVSDKELPILLLLLGVMGFIGTILIGKFLGRGLYQTMSTISLIMAVVAMALVSWGTRLIPVAVLLALWGLVSTAAPVGWWSWVANVMPDNAEAGGGLIVALIQLAIGLGSTVGGVLFDTYGYQSTFGVSACFLLISMTLTIATARAVRKHCQFA